MISTSPLMPSTMFIISVPISSHLFLLHLMQNDPSEAGRMTSFSSCNLNLGLAFTIVSICEKLVTSMNPLEPTSTVVCGLIAVLCAAVH